jgi:hypothetical protein
MTKLGAVLNLFFGCRHRQLTRIFTIDRRTYRVCCNCGMKFDYSLESMSIRAVRFRKSGDIKARRYNPNVVGAR